MSSLNRVVLIGRITRDPEVKYVGNDSKPVANFTLAVDRGKDQDADFINITAWQKSAEFVGQYVKKGRLLAVEGRLQVRKYQDKDGNNRTATEVVADRVQALDKPKEAGTTGGDDESPFAND